MDNKGNNALSIASLTCGIVSAFVLPFIFGLIAIILGIIGVSKQEEKSTFSIIGMVLGIVGIIWAYYSTGMM